MDHALNESDPLRCVKAVAVDERAQLAYSLLHGRKLVHDCDVVIVKLTVEPRSMGDLVESIYWSCELPIDERDWKQVAGDDVPWGWFSVSDD